MNPTLQHRLSLGLAILTGLAIALREPEQRAFERTMRSLDVTGQLLGILDPLSSIVFAFVAMLLVYALAYLALAAAGHAFTSLRGAPTP